MVPALCGATNSTDLGNALMSELGLRTERVGRRVAVSVSGCVIGILAIAGGTFAATRESSKHHIAPDSSLLQRMLEAEDSRALGPSALAPLFTGLRSSDGGTRRRAARAFGRLERSPGLTALRGSLADSSPAVRAEAVNAIAQILSGEAQRARAAGDSATDLGRTVVNTANMFTAMLPGERDSVARDVIVRSLVRLPYPSPAAALAAVNSLFAADTTSPSGVARARPDGVSAFARAYALDGLLRRQPTLRNEAVIVKAVSGLSDERSASSRADTWTREARVLRASARGRVLVRAAGGTGVPPNVSDEIGRAFVGDFGDLDPQVRRQVVSLVPVATALDDSTRTRLVDAALRDPSAHVRVEGVRAYARRANVPCAPLVAASRDSNAHVALAAIDVFSTVTACREAGPPVDRLLELVRAIPARDVPSPRGRGTWHSGAHAVVALARVAPDRAPSVLRPLASHAIWQVRMYAATAAGVLPDTALLARLASDRSDNVRDAAVNALASLVRAQGPGNAAPRRARDAWVDSIFIAQLARPDHQLVLDAARALEGAPTSPRLRSALIDALARLTSQRSETSRDPRVELLARIAAVGERGDTARLAQYVSDFDPAVAVRAARTFRAWGMTDAVPSPRQLQPVPVSLRDVGRLGDARVRITMAPASGGGSFELRLFPDEAPATVARFVSLARRGYYNGLTFHRVATNFVIQGGSPGANEYVGADRFMRDELGLRSHTRGTLGISTRGRDTGDAQIFVNLIDNFRLDHDYTVFAEVVRGMDVVDAVLEGAVIARIDVIGTR
jgi:cyclophilin family peptidyl-prolyl cis-trans isomerase/HEAT repeat protein